MSREAFEKWVIDDMRGVPLDTSQENGMYLAPCLSRMLRTWQARQPEIDALKAEVERLRKDAERYQWLRNVGGRAWHIVDDHKSPIMATGRYYDAAIDAAMKEPK